MEGDSVVVGIRGKIQKFRFYHSACLLVFGFFDGVKSPSLYNHIDGFDDLKQQLMLYGWKELENRIIEAVIGLSGYDAIRAMCYAFHEYAIENQGVFSTMLWYNQFENEQMNEVSNHKA